MRWSAAAAVVMYAVVYAVVYAVYKKATATVDTGGGGAR